jgi:anti-anti-sigma factor
VRITQSLDGQGTVRLALSGELDMASAETLAASVDHALRPDRPAQLVVDLAGVTFCDSTGIRALVDARAAALRCQVAFRTVNPRGLTRRVMSVTGVLDVLTSG